MAAELVTLAEGENVVFLSSGEELASQRSKQLVAEFSRAVGANGKVTSLPLNSTGSENKSASGYDSCVVGFGFPAPVSEDTLSYALQLLKPDGKLWILEATADDDCDGSALTKEQLQSKLKLNGFVDVEFKKTVDNLDKEIERQLTEKLNIKSAVKFSCFSSCKPNYEIGASAPLKLNQASVAKTLTLTPAQQVWTLSADDVDDFDDDDLLDSDEVLDEVDLTRPDPLSLRAVCGDAEVKRKACKNCSCGLAEELEAEKTEKALAGIDPGQKKSSCGSCYLGDAFRCAGCPFRGTPAFKPGESASIQ